MNQLKDYRALNEELEGIIEKLQSSDLDVDQVLNYYQRGTALLTELEKYLQSARNKVTKLTSRELQD